MVEVIWSPRALRDADAIARFIAEDSPVRASLFTSRLIQAVKLISDFPRLGRRIPETRYPAYRQILVGPYRVIYRVAGRKVLIMGVIHGARDWRPNASE